ncbi:MAG: LysM peptidoglycan-binding domain-containing protein [Spirochaetes bacterium]|nr:LysM peptidoglycan-binding domain-containing protein [Spirochaetota bacterium]
MERHLFWKLLLVFFIPIYLWSEKAMNGPSLEEQLLSNPISLEIQETNFAVKHAATFSDESVDLIKQSNLSLVTNPYVKDQIDYFLNKKRDFFESSLKRAETYIVEMKSIFREYQLPEELAYLPLIESGFKPYAVSYQGARGMWQFMPGTSRWMGMKMDTWVDERYDPIAACHYAARFLKYLYEKFQDWNLALAAYNYGGVNVKKAIYRAKTADFYELVKKRALPYETRTYVPRFIATIYLIKNKERYSIPFDETKSEYTYYTLPFMCTVSLFTNYAKIDKNEFKKLNPGLRTEFIPKKTQNYSLRIPLAAIENVEKNLSKMKEKSFDHYLTYTIQSGDSLSVISERYGINLDIIKSVNNIRNVHRIWIGQKIFIPLITTGGKTTVKTTDKESSKYFFYIVKAGETISHIAYKFGIPADTIIKWNQISNPKLIQVGQKIKLYRN